MIDKIVSTQALLKHLGLFVLFYIFSPPLPPIRTDTVGGDQ